MIKYFLQNKDIEQISKVCDLLNKTKYKLLNDNWENPSEYFESSSNLFSEIKEIAIQRNDEKLANAQFIFKDYFKLFCSLLRYFDMLEKRQYKDSWGKLQDCLDAIKYIGHFTEIDDRLELNNLYDLLVQYEELYPYKIFASSEYVISKSPIRCTTITIMHICWTNYYNLITFKFCSIFTLYINKIFQYKKVIIFFFQLET